MKFVLKHVDSEGTQYVVGTQKTPKYEFNMLHPVKDQDVNHENIHKILQQNEYVFCYTLEAKSLAKRFFSTVTNKKKMIRVIVLVLIFTLVSSMRLKSSRKASKYSGMIVKRSCSGDRTFNQSASGSPHAMQNSIMLNRVMVHYNKLPIQCLHCPMKGGLSLKNRLSCTALRESAEDPRSKHF